MTFCIRYCHVSFIPLAVAVQYSYAVMVFVVVACPSCLLFSVSCYLSIALDGVQFTRRCCRHISLRSFWFAHVVSVASRSFGDHLLRLVANVIVFQFADCPEYLMWFLLRLFVGLFLLRSPDWC